MVFSWNFPKVIPYASSDVCIQYSVFSYSCDGMNVIFIHKTYYIYVVLVLVLALFLLTYYVVFSALNKWWNCRHLALASSAFFFSPRANFDGCFIHETHSIIVVFVIEMNCVGCSFFPHQTAMPCGYNLFDFCSSVSPFGILNGNLQNLVLLAIPSLKTTYRIFIASYDIIILIIICIPSMKIKKKKQKIMKKAWAQERSLLLY